MWSFASFRGAVGRFGYLSDRCTVFSLCFQYLLRAMYMGSVS